jgi:glucan phosphoethanolaminetransferase (alkaline phosphatase superfamily)
MTKSDKILCVLYAVVALACLIGTQWVLVDYMVGGGTVGDALAATVDGHAATFVTIDLLGVAIAATIFMIVDGRRNRVPLLWLYVVLVFVIAVSVAFPLYLIARTWTLARSNRTSGRHQQFS